jgi:hypothetical protein
MSLEPDSQVRSRASEVARPSMPEHGCLPNVTRAVTSMNLVVYGSVPDSFRIHVSVQKLASAALTVLCQ